MISVIGGDFMLITDSQKRATNKYLKANYTQINIRVRSEKGEKYKEYFKRHPEIKMNKAIEQFLDDLISQDQQQQTTE